MLDGWTCTSHTCSAHGLSLVRLIGQWSYPTNDLQGIAVDTSAQLLHCICSALRVLCRRAGGLSLRMHALQAYRLLAEEQYNRGWDYPLHLGVTEVRQHVLVKVLARAPKTPRRLKRPRHSTKPASIVIAFMFEKEGNG